MLSFGSRDDEPVRRPRSEKPNAQIGVNKRSWRNLHLQKLLLLPLKSFSIMKMFEKSNSLKRCKFICLT